MSILVGDNLTLLDIQKRINSDGTLAQIVELLQRKKPIFEDVPFVEANDVTSHLVTTRTSLPTGQHRRFNQGVRPSKSTTEQGREPIAMIRDFSEPDASLVDLSGNAEQKRAQEDAAFMEGIMQTVATTMFYGNHTLENEKIDGLATRYGLISAGGEEANNIIDAGGSGSDNASMFLVGWGMGGCYGIYPKGHPSGLQHKDWGRVIAERDDGRLEVYRSQFDMSYGLVVEDWRNVGRIANIDVSDLAAAGTSGYSGADLINDMIDLVNLPHGGVGNGLKYCIYAPKVVKTALDKLARSDTNMNLTIDRVEGKPVTTFYGVPVKEENSLLSTEARVV